MYYYAWLFVVSQEIRHPFPFAPDIGFPTKRSTAWEQQNPWHDVSELHKISQSPELGALTL